MCLPYSLGADQREKTNLNIFRARVHEQVHVHRFQEDVIGCIVDEGGQCVLKKHLSFFFLLCTHGDLGNKRRVHLLDLVVLPES